MSRVFITGITGMDGSILADYLLSQGHTVYGLVRQSASPNYWRIQHLLNHPHVHLLDGDITTQDCVYRAIEQSEPEMVFNLAAQSFVPYSWAAPIDTMNITGLGPVNILEVIRNTDKSIKFYQASSSEMFGKVQETTQSESTPFYPRSPYGVAKVAAHFATINYRESFGIHACCGILFNHEHERRGEQFVTRKITRGIAQFFSKKIKNEIGTPLELGNLEAKRDWGYAEDYVKGMVKIVQHTTPDTFVLATGVTRTVREWCEASVVAAVRHLNLPANEIVWKGSGDHEQGFFGDDLLFVVSKKFYRPAEVDLLLGCPKKAEKELGWQPETSFETMIDRMMYADIQKVTEKEPLFI